MKATGLMAAAAALALSPTPAAAQEVPIKVGILDAKGDRLVTPSDDVEVNYREFVTGNLISGRMKASVGWDRSEEHTSELQSLMRSSYDVFCLKQKKVITTVECVSSVRHATTALLYIMWCSH